MTRLEFTSRGLEHMDTPGNPRLGLGLGHVEEVGEGARLDRQGQLAHHFDHPTLQGLAQLLSHQRFNPGDHFGPFGTLENRLHQRPILGVLRRIRFDR